jgi:flavin reductase (DIM6/NTAB) family NADH-FMN oxidoreductase RutF
MSKIEVDLRRATRLLEPGPVCLVTVRYKGRANVMPAAWVTPVSSDPPMVALAVFPARFTHDLIQTSGTFALNIPPQPLADAVKKAGDLSGEETDKFLALHLTPYEAKQIAAPLILECIGHLECGVTDVIPVGDHSLFLGEIVAASVDEGAFNGEAWTLITAEVKPLHHLGANLYATLQMPLSVPSTI